MYATVLCFFAPGNMSVKCIPPHTPLLYSKSFGDIPSFLIFDTKQRLWVFVRKVQVGKDQEKAHSANDSQSKNRGGKKTN